MYQRTSAARPILLGDGMLSAWLGPKVPRLTAEQKEAIQMFDQLAGSPELALTGRLEPGDIQLLNNHTILHARSEFVDHLAVIHPRIPFPLQPSSLSPLCASPAHVLECMKVGCGT